LEKDYTAFVHVYDSHGHRIAQGDSLIVDEGLRPTSQWQNGASGTTLHHLSIPAGTPPGRYEVQAGAYHLLTGRRLSLSNVNEGAKRTSVRLSTEVGLPDHPPEPEDLEMTHPVDRDIVSQLRLLGYDLQHRAVVAGEHLPIRLFWKASGKIDQDYRLRLTLRSGDGTTYAARDFELLATGYAATLWQPGAVFQEWYAVPVGERWTSGEVILVLNLVDAGGRLVLAQPVELATVWVQSLEPSFARPPDVDERGLFRLDDGVSLLGYDLETREKHPGDTLKVTLYWGADAEIERSYKVFVHLYDEEGNIVSQRDRIPGLGVRPTTSWQLGEVVADRYHVGIAAGTAPGVCSVAVGMYDAETGERVSVFGSDGERLAQDRILLGELSIQR
jgi:hypothetical protein